MLQRLKPKMLQAGKTVLKQAERVDQLKLKNGLKITTEDDGCCVTETHIAVDQVSSPATACGTLVALVVLILFATQIISTFVSQQPTINEVSNESLGTEYDLPDVAITLSVPDTSERDLLRFAVPEFRWITVENGFTNRVNKEEMLQDVKFGDECNLQAGYQVGASGDSGSASWPVFCVPATSTLKLRGRFGDPSWSFLQIRLSKCNAASSANMATRLKEHWNSAGDPSCASPSEMLSKLGSEFGFNIWFKFPREPDRLSGVYNRWKLLPAEGMLPGTPRPGWSWFVYERLGVNATTSLTLDLRHNTADVNNPLSLSGGEDTKYQWFNFHDYSASPSGTSSADFTDVPFLTCSLRVAWMKRRLSVRYKNIQEMITDVSGSWAAAIGVGTLSAMVLMAVVAQPQVVPSGRLSELVMADKTDATAGSIARPNQQQTTV
jgi:hypothetical protein